MVLRTCAPCASILRTGLLCTLVSAKKRPFLVSWGAKNLENKVLSVHTIPNLTFWNQNVAPRKVAIFGRMDPLWLPMPGQGSGGPIMAIKRSHKSNIENEYQTNLIITRYTDTRQCQIMVRFESRGMQFFKVLKKWFWMTKYDPIIVLWCSERGFYKKVTWSPV